MNVGTTDAAMKTCVASWTLDRNRGICYLITWLMEQQLCRCGGLMGRQRKSGNGITHWPVYGALSAPWALASYSLQVEFQNNTWRFYIVALSYLREHGTSSDVTFRYLLNLPAITMTSAAQNHWYGKICWNLIILKSLNSYVMQSHLYWKEMASSAEISNHNQTVSITFGSVPFQSCMADTGDVCWPQQTADSPITIKLAITFTVILQGRTVCILDIYPQMSLIVCGINWCTVTGHHIKSCQDCDNFERKFQSLALLLYDTSVGALIDKNAFWLHINQLEAVCAVLLTSFWKTSLHVSEIVSFKVKSQHQ